MQRYSVLMALYKSEKPDYLRLAIESMLNQTVMPDEIVIVKDGPLGNELEEILEEYSRDDIFRIVGYPENQGLGFALNYGLSKCSNELVARMDTDDISKPNRCEEQLKHFDADDELVLLGSSVDEFVSDPSIIVSRRVVPVEPERLYEFAKRRSAFNHPSVMYRKSAVMAVGGYHNMRRNQDVDLFGRMLFSGAKAQNIEESLLLFRSNGDLAKRRKSWENTKSYIGTIGRFWKMGYSSFLDFFLVATAQTMMFILPSRVQHLVYRLFLREN